MPPYSPNTARQLQRWVLHSAAAYLDPASPKRQNALMPCAVQAGSLLHGVASVPSSQRWSYIPFASTFRSQREFDSHGTGFSQYARLTEASCKLLTGQGGASSDSRRPESKLIS